MLPPRWFYPGSRSFYKFLAIPFIATQVGQAVIAPTDADLVHDRTVVILVVVEILGRKLS